MLRQCQEKPGGEAIPFSRRCPSVHFFPALITKDSRDLDSLKKAVSSGVCCPSIVARSNFLGCNVHIVHIMNMQKIVSCNIEAALLGRGTIQKYRWVLKAQRFQAVNVRTLPLNHFWRVRRFLTAMDETCCVLFRKDAKKFGLWKKFYVCSPL